MTTTSSAAPSPVSAPASPVASSVASSAAASADSSAASSGRQVVVLCDGTNNNLTGGQADTNVVKLLQLFAAHPDADRLVFYDPGVGNAETLPGATAWDRLRRWADRIHGLAMGRGVYENMVEAYLFLMRHVRPGDALFFFGFSRGAFTARSVAGLVNQFGLLAPHQESLLPTLLNVYFADRSEPARIERVARQIRATCVDRPDIDLHFVGVWDTVAAVGFWPVELKFTALPTLEGKRFIHVRQALALDEHRAKFLPRLYAQPDGPFRTRSGREGSIAQRWFPGSHCDVGGGYADAECSQSDIACAWLIDEALQCGLRLPASASAANTAAEAARPVRAGEALTAALPPALPRNMPCAHSELRRNPLWAVAGMAVRDTTQVVMDNGDARPLPSPQADASVAQLAMQVPNSVWVGAHPPWWVWVAVLLAPLCYAMHGYMLAPHGVDSLRDLGTAAEHATAFQAWLLSSGLRAIGALPDGVNAALTAPWIALHQGFRAPRWAVAWDFALLASYATALSWWSARAFSRCAGLRTPGDGPRPWLNRLGHALKLAVLADVAENLLFWSAAGLAGMGVHSLALVGLLMAALAGLAKFVGLAGVAALIGWSLMRR